jgi:hypothetical protein
MTVTIKKQLAIAFNPILAKLNDLVQSREKLLNWNNCHDEKGMFCEGGGLGSGAGGSYTPYTPKGMVGAGTFPAHASEGRIGTIDTNGDAQNIANNYTIDEIRAEIEVVPNTYEKYLALKPRATKEQWMNSPEYKAAGKLSIALTVKEEEEFNRLPSYKAPPSIKKPPRYYSPEWA